MLIAVFFFITEMVILHKYVYLLLLLLSERLLYSDSTRKNETRIEGTVSLRLLEGE